MEGGILGEAGNEALGVSWRRKVNERLRVWEGEGRVVWVKEER